MAHESQSLIAELDATLHKASSSQHGTILRRVTDLLVAGAARFSCDHVAIFDDVLGRLVGKAERSALIELSGRLASIDNAPANVIDCLARHDDIAIAGPILHKSTTLEEQSLTEIARVKSEGHLSAIAGRTWIGESTTDVLMSRCSSETARKLADNNGARFSEVGFVKLINRAKSDKSLAAAIQGRTDLPPELEPFLKLALV
jgi:uncharacterized protein (DUF2336 family)